jgi:hypothetical protein
MVRTASDTSAARLTTATALAATRPALFTSRAVQRGFEQGHFKCLHASCAHRDDGDFLNAIGIRNDDFEDLTSTEVAEPLPLPAVRGVTNGDVSSRHISNAAKAVVRPDFVNIDIRFDQFRDEIMFAPADSGQWQAFTDPDYARLRIHDGKARL